MHSTHFFINIIITYTSTHHLKLYTECSQSGGTATTSPSACSRTIKCLFSSTPFMWQWLLSSCALAPDVLLQRKRPGPCLNGKHGGEGMYLVNLVISLASFVSHG
jgi:hypothetical protein